MQTYRVFGHIIQKCFWIGIARHRITSQYWQKALSSTQVPHQTGTQKDLYLTVRCHTYYTVPSTEDINVWVLSGNVAFLPGFVQLN